MALTLLFVLFLCYNDLVEHFVSVMTALHARNKQERISILHRLYVYADNLHVAVQFMYFVVNLKGYGKKPLSVRRERVGHIICK